MSSFYESGAIETKLHLRTPKFLPPLQVSKSNQKEIAIETPIFYKRRVTLHLPKDNTGEYAHITVKKNWFVCILTAPTQTTLYRFFLPRAIPPDEFKLENYVGGYNISKVFLDYSGFHIFITLSPKTPGLLADFLYIHGNGKKVRRFEKLKEHEITAVAFNNYLSTESSTGPILLGTTRGLIFETELTYDIDKPSYRRQVYDLGVGRVTYPIFGLELFKYPQKNTYVVVVAAVDSIYIFQETLKIEENSLQAIFAGYISGHKVYNQIEVKTDLNFSIFKFYIPPNAKFPESWAWFCGAGIKHGQVSIDDTNTNTTNNPSTSSNSNSNNSNSNNSILVGDELINLNFEENKHLASKERRQIIPKTFAITRYHILILYEDHITGICKLNNQVNYEEYFYEKLGKLIDITTDPFTGTIYCHTESNIFSLSISNEERDIWRIYLDQGLFDMAEFHAITNPNHMSIILEKKAEVTFSNEQYEEAARIYAETDKPFEEICLKLMKLENKRPIILYLNGRLKTLSENHTEFMKVLIIWLVHLYLTQINLPNITNAERAQWQQEYNNFIREITTNKKYTKYNYAVFIKQLIVQNADAHNLSQFAIQNGDYEEVIMQHLTAGNYSSALSTLQKQKGCELYYKYFPLIIEKLPQESVETMMVLNHKLQIEKLFPSLIVIDTVKHIEEIIKYLEFAVYKLSETNQTLHNYLLRLYCEYKPNKVILYLENQGQDASLVHYDINYALRVCKQFQINIGCVHLYCLLAMWTNAVDLALTFDVKLAKDTASKPRNEEKRRNLWLKIAHHDIKGTNNVKKALELLEECHLLRIEDLLPFFSDFEKIDDFKKPICTSLKVYTQKIHDLQHDMEECNIQGELVRNQLQNVRESIVCIGSLEKCTVCNYFLLTKPFFVFSCGHKFHADCLEKQVLSILKLDSSRKLTMLKQQFDMLTTQQMATTSNSNILRSQKKKEQLKREIEKMLASDCLYCGLMIDLIDHPFVDDWDQINVDWE